MNNNRLNNKKKGLSGLTAAACGLLLLCGCSDFLEPKPLSFYDPTTTFTTEAGLVAHVGRCQRTVDVTKRIAFIRFPVSRQFRKAIFQGKSIAFTVYPNVT